MSCLFSFSFWIGLSQINQRLSSEGFTDLVLSLLNCSHTHAGRPDNIKYQIIMFDISHLKISIIMCFLRAGPKQLIPGQLTLLQSNRKERTEKPCLPQLCFFYHCNVLLQHVVAQH